jgi:hypothetical protein
MTVAVDPGELVYVRSYIGETELEATFNERFDRQYTAQSLLGTWGDLVLMRARAINLAIEESMRAQIAVLTLDQPGQGKAGDASYSYDKNIDALEKDLKRFMALKGSFSGSVSQMKRANSRR